MGPEKHTVSYPGKKIFFQASWLPDKKHAAHRMASGYDVIVSCEHASNALPPELNGLGVPPEALLDHHAWDPGAGEVASYLAMQLGAPVFLGKWSRLVADLNRPDDIPSVIPENSFGLRVPHNEGLSEAERQERLEMYHRPYWRAVAEEIRKRVSMHSFTPEYDGVVRAVSLGVMYDPDYPLEHALGKPMVHRIRQLGFVAEVNQPYDGRAAALTTSCRNRFPAHSYAGIEIEMNQRHMGELDRVKTVVLDAIRYAIASQSE
jgi:predicted N-formylglutamate amidohydrolase